MREAYIFMGLSVIYLKYKVTNLLLLSKSNLKRQIWYLTNEYFVSVRSIDIGGVQMGDTSANSMVDELDHVGLGLGRAVEG